MRQIKAIPLTTDEWKDWLEECEQARQEAIDIVANGDKPEVSNLYKKKYIRDHYYFAEDAPPFYGKCVYCETGIVNIFPGDVEHFRPKGKVTDENHQPIYLRDDAGNIQLDADGEKVPHPGYYWLAYDWKNLMPSCTYCNRPKEDFGKRNCFPVVGQRACYPGEEAGEVPLIINPLSDRPEDDPEQHFDLDLDKGLLIGKTERGRFCIELFGLNKRKFLRDGRKNAADSAKAALFKLISSPPAMHQTILDEMKPYTKGEKHFSLAFVLAVKSYKALLTQI